VPHGAYFRFHFDFVFGRLDYVVRLLDGEVADGFALLMGNLDFGQHAVADGAEHPDLVATLHQIIVALVHQMAVNGIEQEVIEDHEGVQRHAAMLQHEHRNEHAVIEQVFGHRCINEWFVLLDIKRRVREAVFHSIIITLASVAKNCGGLISDAMSVNTSFRLSIPV
jgi:hypothetical protein